MGRSVPGSERTVGKRGVVARIRRALARAAAMGRRMKTQCSTSSGGRRPESRTAPPGVTAKPRAACRRRGQAPVRRPTKRVGAADGGEQKARESFARRLPARRRPTATAPCSPRSRSCRPTAEPAMPPADVDPETRELQHDDRFTASDLLQIESPETPMLSWIPSCTTEGAVRRTRVARARAGSRQLPACCVVVAVVAAPPVPTYTICDGRLRSVPSAAHGTSARRSGRPGRGRRRRHPARARCRRRAASGATALWSTDRHGVATLLDEPVSWPAHCVGVPPTTSAVLDDTAGRRLRSRSSVAPPLRRASDGSRSAKRDVALGGVERQRGPAGTRSISWPLHCTAAPASPSQHLVAPSLLSQIRS